jgi:hypothetical protein
MRDPDDWRDPPEGWNAYRAAQARGVTLGLALDWNGAHYALWSPGWRYAYSPTLAGMVALLDERARKLAAEEAPTRERRAA